MKSDDLTNLKERFPEIIAVVEMGRDGSPILFSVSSGIHVEIFSIMCATIMGAAGTAASEVNGGPMDIVVARGERTSIVVASVDSKHLLACALKNGTDVNLVIEAMKELIHAG